LDSLNSVAAHADDANRQTAPARAAAARCFPIRAHMEQETLIMVWLHNIKMKQLHNL